VLIRVSQVCDDCGPNPGTSRNIVMRTRKTVYRAQYAPGVPGRFFFINIISLSLTCGNFLYNASKSWTSVCLFHRPLCVIATIRRLIIGSRTRSRERIRRTAERIYLHKFRQVMFSFNTPGTHGSGFRSAAGWKTKP
jgi:hypothetical protein